MKRRVRKIANFFAFNLLFFALYLNFIHKDQAAVQGTSNIVSQKNTPAFSGTVLVENPEQYAQPQNETVVAAQQPAEDKTQPLKISIN